LQRLFGRLTDHAIAHPLADSDRDEKHGRTRGQENGGQPHGRIHCDVLDPSEWSDDVEFGRARSAVFRLAHQMHFSQLARGHFDSGRLSAKLE
jgi:hypothetical protein